MWRTLRIDTNTQKITQEDYKEEYRLLGGRSLISQFLLDEVDPTCDPLGEKNKLLFCTGLLAGTGVTGGNRLSVGGKSPLTGGVKESNSGGMAALLMAQQGIKMIILEGKPKDDEWKILHIDGKGEAKLEPAGDLVGKGTYDVTEALVEKYGDGIGIITIGPGGEREYKGAGIGINEFRTNHPCRLAARGGMGALMGSKRIKAVIMEKPDVPYTIEYADEAKFNEAKLALNKAAAAASKESVYSTIGTIGMLAGTSAQGVLPTRNFSGEYFKKNEDIGPGKFMENLKERGGKNHVACQPGCVVCCSNEYNGPDGKHLTSGFEYETVGICGSNLDISNLDTIAKIDRFCDDMGLDTIEVGAAIGVCMYEKKIPWGDEDAVFKLLEEVRRGTEMGNVIGNGAYETGQHLGSTHVPVCKKQAMAAYDPRNVLGTGITYATTPMGADHTAGVTFGTGDGYARKMQLYLSKTYQSVLGAADSYMCIFSWALGAVKNLNLVADMMTALYGVEYKPELIPAGGMQTVLKEREFNRRAGFTIADDDVPQFMHDEPSPYTGSVFDFTPEEMVSIYDVV